MSDRPHGKYVTIDPDNPEALAVCDRTGFVFRRKDLVRQMEWRGTRLVWTGFYVGRPYLDQPNPQLKSPTLEPDPVPVREPRLPQFTPQTWDKIADATWDRQGTPWELWGGLQPETPAIPSVAVQRLTWDHLNTTRWEDVSVPWNRWHGIRRLPEDPRREPLDAAYFGAFA